MVTIHPTSTMISIISVIIAGAAYFTSWRTQRAQRANYKLQQEISERPGHLKEITTLYRDKRERLGVGFRILNGPTEMPVTDAVINMTYTVHKHSAVRFEEKFTLPVRAKDFGVLGISGPKFEFTLTPYKQAEWRFPLSSSWYLPELTSIDNEVLTQQIEFVFSVTVAGETTSSEPEFLFGGDICKPTFGYKYANGSRSSLEDIIVGSLAADRVNLLRRENPNSEIPSELAAINPHSDVPSGLRNWIFDAWEHSGKFSDDSLEGLARLFLLARSKAEMAEQAGPGAEHGKQAQ